MKRLLVLIVSLIFSFSYSQAEFSIMSYNIRQASANDGINNWDLRKNSLLKLLTYYQPDIIGTQEGQSVQIHFLKENLKGYDFVGEPRTNDEYGEYSALFYNTNKLEVKEFKTFWLSETPNKISKGWDAACERIVTYALFQEKLSRNEFWVINTHFDHLGEIARKKEAEIVLSTVKELNLKKQVPIFVTGDFNAIHTDEPIQILKKELVDTRDISISKPYGPENTFTGFQFPSGEKKQIIDYIFVKDNQNVQIEKVRILADFYGNGFYPSDHFPVLVNFNL